MFLKLLVDPFPDFDSALYALQAAKAVCDQAGLPPFIAWRDYVDLQAWYAGAHSDEMVSDDEMDGADTWETALTAARHALRLPSHVPMAIEVILPSKLHPLLQQHGPSRRTWRRHRTGSTTSGSGSM